MYDRAPGVKNTLPGSGQTNLVIESRDPLPVHDDGDSECLQQFHASTMPVLVKQSLGAQTRRLCYSEFAVLHSGVTRTPIWSAEHLTPERIQAATQLLRPRSSFHAELRVPISERAELDDYKQSGFDRGHMSPNGDMSNEIAQKESFSLANIVPQNPCHNESLWEGIETAVRELALETEIFVVTGPAFLGDEIQTLDQRVFVPTNI
jgi:endonuclease G, mitochondrial